MHSQIASAVYQVLYEGETVAEMAQGLMSRPIAADELGLRGRSAMVESLMQKLGIEDEAK